MSPTTVIASYNRQHCIARAVRSALTTFPTGEVIVVDDASQDNTVPYLSEIFSAELAEHRVQIVAIPKNLGVTGAKNTGYKQASRDWVVFLDSDDEYIQAAGPLVESELATAHRRPIVFFRCNDQAGKSVGERQGNEIELDLSTYLCKTSFGEALTAINKRLVGDVAPYPTELRGYEGLGCCRLIQKFGPALLSRHVARIYYTDGADRLSVSSGFLKRMPLLAKGHWLMTMEFWPNLGGTKSLAYVAKAVVYLLLGYGYQLFRAVVR
jgi:glycosyltransferase involved in cell wall biosynthesis